MDVINLQSKFDLIKDHWTPHIIASLNHQDVKLAKVQGEFIWHDHENEDELFLIIKGQLKMELETGTKIINEGELIVIPKGVQHRPYAEEECWILLFEPQSTKHTGVVVSDRTVHDLKRI